LVKRRFFQWRASLLTSSVMEKNSVIFIILALVVGFIGGFVLANKLNGSEIAELRAQSAQKPPANSNTMAQPSSTDVTLTPEELQAKIAEADKNPTNAAYQKDLGIALYRYAAMKQDDDLLIEAVRILERADTLKPKDFDILVALGNAHFDIGFYKEDAAQFQAARDVYTKALQVKPGDVDVQTDFGITYFLQKPPALDKAAAELQKVSELNPNHSRSLQFLVQTYIKQNKLPDAERALARLKSIEPKNPAITDLSTKLSAAQAGS
jgi:tetratricopeptide (TPR) repeat protein